MAIPYTLKAIEEPLQELKLLQIDISRHVDE